MKFGSGEPAVIDPRRVRITRHLSEHGPTPGDALADALGLSGDQFWAVINHSWFDVTGKGYVLTEASKREWLG